MLGRGSGRKLDRGPGGRSAARPILCAVLDGPTLGEDAFARARAIFEAGVDWIQLRDRSLEDAALWRIATGLTRARDAVTTASDSRVQLRVIVNRRVDLALAAGADGAHLGFDALDPASSRALLGAHALIGASLHSVEEVASAADRPLDYVHLAPIWRPLSKPATRPALGLEILAEACRVGPPVLAQGGVDADRAGAAIEAGAAGVAVTGILQAARDLRETVGPLRERLDRRSPSHAAE